LVLPTAPITDFSALDAQATTGLAGALSVLTKAYDAVFNCDFPYSAGFHQAPCDGLAHPEWTLHLHFYPPLLRSASVKKFQVGYEMLAEAQRDMTAEQDLVSLPCVKLIQISSIKGVLGARMMGGGFGGCLLVLAKASFFFDRALPTLFAAYEKRYGLAAESIKVKLNNGVSSVYLT
jgi:hypothetical protein